MVKIIPIGKTWFPQLQREKAKGWKKSAIIREQEWASQIHHRQNGKKKTQFNFYIPRNIPAANPSEVPSTGEQKYFEWCSLKEVASLSELKPKPAEMLTHWSTAVQH